MNKYVLTLVIFLSLASASAELGYEVKINNSPQDQDIDNVNLSFYSGDYQSDSAYVLKAVSSTGTVLETAPVEIGSYGEALNVSCIETTTEEVDNKTIKRDVCDQAGFDVENTFSTYIPYHPKGEKIILEKDDEQIDTYTISSRLKTNYCGDNRCDMGEDYHTCGSDCDTRPSAQQHQAVSGKVNSNTNNRLTYNPQECLNSEKPCHGQGLLWTHASLDQNENRVLTTPNTPASLTVTSTQGSSFMFQNSNSGESYRVGKNTFSANPAYLRNQDSLRSNTDPDAVSSVIIREGKDLYKATKDFVEENTRFSTGTGPGKLYVDGLSQAVGYRQEGLELSVQPEGFGSATVQGTMSVETFQDSVSDREEEIRKSEEAYKQIDQISNYRVCRLQLLSLRIGKRSTLSNECSQTVFSEIAKAQKIYEDLEQKQYDSITNNISKIRKSLRESRYKGKSYVRSYIGELRHKKEFLTGQCDTIVDAGNFYEGQYRRLDSERGYHVNICNESITFQNKTEVNFSNEPSDILILSDEPDKYKKSIESLIEQAGVTDSLNIISVDHNGSYMKDGKECHAESAASDTIVKAYKERVGAEHAFLIGSDCTTSTVFGDYSVIESGDMLGLQHYFLSSYVGIEKEYDVQLDRKVSFNTCETFNISSVEEGETVGLGCESGKDKKAKTPSLLNPKTVRNGLPGLTEDQKVYVAEAMA